MLSTKLIAVAAVLVVGGFSGVPTQSESILQYDVEPSRLGSEYDGLTFTHAAVVPDADPEGITLGPLSIPDDGQLIQNIMLELDITHSYIGDVEVRLIYDEDRDGRHDASTTLELYRARENDWTSEEMWSYPVAMNGLYYFCDVGPGDETLVPSALARFSGMKKGGEFYLAVADTGAGNTGTLRGWAVYIERDNDRTDGSLDGVH